MRRRIASLALALAMAAGLFCIPASAAELNGSAWAMPRLRQADTMGLIPDILQGQNLTVAINRAELAAICVKAYEHMTGRITVPSAFNPFTDTADPWVLRAFSVGLVAGTSATTYNPNGIVTRSQMATIFTNVYKRVYGVDTLSFAQPTTFQDDSQIEAWAKEPVYFMAANRVIAGKPGNIFDPADSATREMTLVLTVQMIEVFTSPQSSSFEIKTVQELLSVLHSGTFRLRARAEARSFSTIMDLYVKGNMVAMTVNMDSAVRAIYRDGRNTLILDGSSEYMIVDDLGLAGLPGTSIVPDVSSALISTGTAHFDGKLLPYEEYRDTAGAEIYFFFENDRLAGWQGIVNGEAAELIFIALESTVADSVFELPAGYTQVAG
jgi:hypothetical protein